MWIPQVMLLDQQMEGLVPPPPGCLGPLPSVAEPESVGLRCQTNRPDCPRQCARPCLPSVTPGD